jgi:hypothetical protein
VRPGRGEAHPGGPGGATVPGHLPGGGRCTFISEDGHRCEARKLVEFDHIEAFARGGEATESNVRLLCRAHNQYEAKRAFGPEFMRHKRIAAAEARAAAVVAGP